MAVIKHEFVSTIPDEPASGRVRPSDWNKKHLVTFETGDIDELLPDQSGQADKFLQTDGVNASWQSISSDFPLYVVTSDITVSTNRQYTVHEEMILEAEIILEGTAMLVLRS